MLKQGICLCGGGALLRGLDEMIEKETAVSTVIAEDPLTCVARGLGLMIDEFATYRSFLDNPLKPLDINI